MKKIMTLLLASVTSAAMADTEIVDGVTWSYSIVNGEATVTEGTTPCVGEMIVPDTLGGCPVTAIGQHAFFQKIDISAMVLPSTVKSIGCESYFGCTAMSSICLPSGLVSIETAAFRGCSALTEISLPDSLTTLGSYYVFESCSAAKTIKLSANLTTIPYGAFGYCRSVSKIVIPSSVTRIENYAFQQCSAAISLELPEGVQSIGSGAFYGCSSLVSLKIPSSVESVAESAFQWTSGLKSIEVVEGCSCVKVVGDCLVSAAGTALQAVMAGNESVTIPEGIASIPSHMFYQAKTLKEVVLPSTLCTVGSHAFYGCSSLTRIEFPTGFTSFSGEYNFSYCTGLKDAIFNGAPPSNIEKSGLIADGAWYSLSSVILSYPREYGSQWQKVVALAKFNGYKRSNDPAVEYVSVAVRENDPTILDVEYKVKSEKATVKVRALAFEDGERSFAKVVRPIDFIEGTDVNIGDAITANVEHKLSWRVSTDWKTDLAKCRFEVLAVENDLLPLELRTIPANGDNKAMEISWNAITESQVFDALLWLYADGDSGLTLSNGELKRNDGHIIAFNTCLADVCYGEAYVYNNNPNNGKYFGSAICYVYSKMGFDRLTGSTLTYANNCTRLGLSPAGIRQYAYKIIEE